MPKPAGYFTRDDKVRPLSRRIRVGPDKGVSLENVSRKALLQDKTFMKMLQVQPLDALAREMVSKTRSQGLRSVARSVLEQRIKSISQGEAVDVAKKMLLSGVHGQYVDALLKMLATRSRNVPTAFYDAGPDVVNALHDVLESFAEDLTQLGAAKSDRENMLYVAAEDVLDDIRDAVADFKQERLWLNPARVEALLEAIDAPYSHMTYTSTFIPLQRKLASLMKQKSR